MKKVLILSLLFLNISWHFAGGQQSWKFDVGVGTGLNYGGYGGKISFLPVAFSIGYHFKFLKF